MHEFGDLHVIATILRDLHHLALLVPLDRLQTLGRFLDSQRRRRNRVRYRV